MVVPIDRQIRGVNGTASHNNTKNAYVNDALGTLDATGVAQRISAGKISALEAVDAAIARAGAVNTHLNAIVADSFGAARAAAKLTSDGFFNGVPTFIKDTEQVEGFPMRLGSRALPATPCTFNSKYVDQLLSTGLVSLGKTTMPEFGLSGVTECLLTGATRNPWNTDHSPGGSSGGSAALVAAGVVPIAYGNDGGGSTRIPSACCGLVGLKPTQHRLHEIWFTEAAPLQIMCQGIITRSVRDTANYYAACEQHFQNPNLPPLGLVKHPGKERLRVGLFTDSFDGEPSQEETVQAVEQAGKLLESLGHTVEPIKPPFNSQLVDDFFLYWAASAYGTKLNGRELISPDFDPQLMEKNLTTGFCEYYEKRMDQTEAVLARLMNVPNEMRNIFSQYDILLSPTLADTAPEIGYLGTDVDFATHLERIRKWVAFTPIYNAANNPAVTLPLGMSSNGLPIGVQFAAAHNQERQLLELAFEIEAAAPWPRLDQYLQVAK